MSFAPKQDEAGLAMRKVLFVVVLGLIFLSIGLAAFRRTSWIIPPAEKARTNPLTASEDNLQAARKIYNERCDNCHGEGGKGDGSDARLYDPAPSDLTDPTKIDKRTDGEIFYQISEGKKPMPSFKKKLTDEQRWQLVLLVRWFAAQHGPERLTK
jgi:mono/diheme cytochrome c family protein